MKKRTVTLALVILGATLLPTMVSASEKKGLRLYKKKMQRKCKMAGSLFARKHTQEEWEKLREKGTFKTEAGKICPAVDFSKFSPKQWSDLYDFSYAYGIGGRIPHGCDPV